MIALVTIVTVAGIGAARRGSDGRDVPNVSLATGEVSILRQDHSEALIPAVWWVASGRPMHVSPELADPSGGLPIVVHAERAVQPAAEQWRGLIERYEGWDVEKMLRIVQCESSGDPDIISLPDYDGIRNYGGFQHHGDPFAAGHPEYSTHQAYLKWQARGYQPWVGSMGCWG